MYKFLEGQEAAKVTTRRLCAFDLSNASLQSGVRSTTLSTGSQDTGSTSSLPEYARSVNRLWVADCIGSVGGRNGSPSSPKRIVRQRRVSRVRRILRLLQISGLLATVVVIFQILTVVVLFNEADTLEDPADPPTTFFDAFLEAIFDLAQVQRAHVNTSSMINMTHRDYVHFLSFSSSGGNARKLRMTKTQAPARKPIHLAGTLLMSCPTAVLMFATSRLSLAYSKRQNSGRKLVVGTPRQSTREVESSA